MEAAETVKELEFGKGPMACMYGGGILMCTSVQRYVHGKHVCACTCHVFCLLLSLSIMYGVLCVCQCALPCVSICGRPSAYL